MPSQEGSALDVDAVARGLAEMEQAIAERDRYRQALETAQGEAYLGALEGDDTPDPLAACHNVLKVCLEALSA